MPRAHTPMGHACMYGETHGVARVARARAHTAGNCAVARTHSVWLAFNPVHNQAHAEERGTADLKTQARNARVAHARLGRRPLRR